MRTPKPLAKSPTRVWRAKTTKPKGKLHRSTHVTLRQSSNLMEALAFARKIGTPLNTHATIHWIGTKAGDDPDGRRSAKVREGFDKWLLRHGVPGGLTAVWVRERLLGGSGGVDHDHMLFHLAHAFMCGRKHVEVVRSLERLIDRHGDGNFADFTLKLTFPPNPDGLYLLKGGGPDVWRKFGVPTMWRASQGVIIGKRCGVTENVGLAARKRSDTSVRSQGDDLNCYACTRLLMPYYQSRVKRRGRIFLANTL
jgi:hypothetical protein